MIINASSALKTTVVRKCCLLNSSVSLYIYNRASRNNAVYNYNFEDVCFVHNSWIARPVIGSVFSASLLDEDIFHKISRIKGKNLSQYLDWSGDWVHLSSKSWSKFIKEKSNNHEMVFSLYPYVVANKFA